MPKTLHPKKVIEQVRATVQPSQITIKTGNGQTLEKTNLIYPVVSNGGAIGVGGETRGFAKVLSDKMNDDLEYESRRLFSKKNVELLEGKPDALGDRGLFTRQVLSYEANKFLGLDILAEEKYGYDDKGRLMVISIQAEGGGGDGAAAEGGSSSGY
jgi:hypothetical protein